MMYRGYYQIMRIICFWSTFVLGVSVADLSIEEQVGQTMMISFEGTEVPARITDLVKRYCLGGIIYYKSNCAGGVEQVAQLSTTLQQQAARNRHRIPLVIAADQEGGRVQRIVFNDIPSQRSVGNMQNPQKTYAIARLLGERLRTAGILMNCAPVADVAELSSFLGDRTYSQDAYEVAQHVGAANEGYCAAGLITVMKHFPGHGGTIFDSHVGVFHVQKSYDELMARDLVPFVTHLDKIPAIMMAHVVYDSFDTNHIATISPYIIQEFLRKQLKYQGVVITDSLTMQGILQKTGTLAEAAILALQAGCDILLFGKEILENGTIQCPDPETFVAIHQSIVSAVRDGRITKERLREAVERILGMKTQYCGL